MTKRIIVSSCAAAVLSIGAATAGQVNPQTPSQAPVQGNQQGTVGQPRPAARTPTGDQITIVGCVAREGTGSEFLLSNAMMANSPSANIAGGVAGSTSADRPSGAPGSTVGTTGTGNAGVTGGGATPSAGASTRSTTSAPGMTYSLTGDREKELSQFVGQKVEIVGTPDGRASAPVSPSPDAAATPRRDRPAEAPPAAGNPTIPAPGGASASGTTPVQRVEIVSFRAVAGTCQ